MSEPKWVGLLSKRMMPKAASMAIRAKCERCGVYLPNRKSKFCRICQDLNRRESFHARSSHE